MNHLVVGSLHKRGIDVAERHHPLAGHAGRQRHGVLLGDSNVESPVGHLLHHHIEGTAGRHGRRYSHYPVVLPGEFYDGLPEDLLIAQESVGSLAGYLFTRLGIEQSRGVVLDRVLLGFAQSFAFLGHNMQKAGTFYVAQAGEGLHQLLHVVAVDRSEIAETERLEEVTLFDESRLDQEEQLAEERHSLLGLALAAKSAPHSLLETVVARRRCDAHQVFAQSTHRTVDRDAVVVEYHQHVGLAHAGVIESLESFASGHGAVADDGDMLTVGVSLQFRRDGHAQRRRYRGRGMAGTESVVGAFAHLGEAAEPALGPYGLELVVAAGKNLVGVSLVSHVPYQFVVRGVEHIMQRYGQFHGAQRRSQVAGMDRQGSYDILPQLGNHLWQLADGQLLQALGIIDFLQ